MKLWNFLVSSSSFSAFTILAFTITDSVNPTQTQVGAVAIVVEPRTGAYELALDLRTVTDADGGAVPEFGCRGPCGAIDYIGDTDVWTFDGLDGDLVRVGMDPVFSDVDPFAILVSPSGFADGFDDNSGRGKGAVIEVPRRAAVPQEAGARIEHEKIGDVRMAQVA